MTLLSNAPTDVTVIEAEARKSFSFGLWFKNEARGPVDITGCSITMTIAKVDKYGAVTALASNAAYIAAPTLGYCTINFQADELAFKPGTYQHTVTLRINGFSVVVMKGEFKLTQNTEFDSTNHDYITTNPALNLEIMLREKNNVHVDLSTVLPPSLVTPTDASDQAVAGYINNPVSLTRLTLDGIYTTIEYVDDLQAYLEEQIALSLDEATDYTDAAVAPLASSFYVNAQNAAQDVVIATKQTAAQVLTAIDTNIQVAGDFSKTGSGPWTLALPGRLQQAGVANVTDLDTALDVGWTRTSSSTANTPTATGAGCCLTSAGGASTYRQDFWRLVAGDSRHWYRIYTGGAWQAWNLVSGAVPDMMWATGPSSYTITASASSWVSLGPSGVTFSITPAEDLWVDVSFNAVCKASSGYVMIGINIAGGLSLAPDEPPGGGAGASHWTPFTSSTVDTGLACVTKRVLLPKGVSTAFAGWTRRNVSSGTHTCNYSVLSMLPVRWAD
jgi:hypothetical protein